MKKIQWNKEMERKENNSKNKIENLHHSEKENWSKISRKKRGAKVSKKLKIKVKKWKEKKIKKKKMKIRIK